MRQLSLAKSTAYRLSQHLIKCRRHAQNYNDWPAIRGCAIVFTVSKWLRSTLCTLVKVNFFGNLIYHTNLSASIERRDGRASPKLRCDTPLSQKCHHQRDVCNGKCFVISKVCMHYMLAKNHCCQGKQWFPIVLKKLCGQLLLSFHIPSYFTMKFYLNPIPVSHGMTKEPLIRTNRTQSRICHPRCSHAFVRVDHESTFYNNNIFMLWIVKN